MRELMPPICGKSLRGRWWRGRRRRDCACPNYGCLRFGKNGREPDTEIRLLCASLSTAILQSLLSSSFTTRRACYNILTYLGIRLVTWVDTQILLIELPLINQRCFDCGGLHPAMALTREYDEAGYSPVLLDNLCHFLRLLWWNDFVVCARKHLRQDINCQEDRK